MMMRKIFNDDRVGSYLQRSEDSFFEDVHGAMFSDSGNRDESGPTELFRDVPLPLVESKPRRCSEILFRFKKTLAGVLQRKKICPQQVTATSLTAEERDRLLETSRALKEIGPLHQNLDESHLVNRIGDEYLISGVLGSGSFGIVLNGRRPTESSKNDVAIKVLVKSDLASIADLQAVNSEICVLRHHGNSHPNIIGFRETIHGPENIYIVLEKSQVSLQQLWHLHSNMFATQPNLFQVITRGILKAVAYLHDVGISHNDLHPGNILICTELDSQRNLNEGRVIETTDIRLCDFGMARMADDYNGMSLLNEKSPILLPRGGLGRPLNRAPETATQSLYDSKKQDVWSLGCILFEINLHWTGVEDWEDTILQSRKNPKAMQRKMAQILKKAQRIPIDGNGPKLMHDLLFKQLLVMNPKKRVSAGQALNHPWFDFEY
ncbi:Mitogen-activated protein kinase HOG1 (Fragment) [Seminavis robusta]|uniref:Mitogen-activated protein kinase HOG1 n=1 Tax=Seminavis robusta TaxID=568900 RepID=A0A9N8HM20_9STRA